MEDNKWFILDDEIETIKIEWRGWIAIVGHCE